jgi:hypothetical protein
MHDNFPPRGIPRIAKKEKKKFVRTEKIFHQLSTGVLLDTVY